MWLLSTIYIPKVSVMPKQITGELPVSHLLYSADISHGEFLARKMKNAVFIFNTWYLSIENPTKKKKNGMRRWFSGIKWDRKCHSL